jgi:transcriptional regulator with XRE-family HTH domain
VPTTKSSTLRSLSEDDLRRVGDAVKSALFHRVFDLIEQVRSDVIDELRFAPLAAEIEEARKRRGLDVKAAAKLLKTSQYVVRQIEQGKLAELKPGVLDRYSEAMGVKDLFGRWKQANPELALRMARPKGQSALMELLEQQALSQVLHAGTAGSAPTTTTHQARRAAGAASLGVKAWQLEIVLQGMDPPVWRRGVVTDDTTLHGLHEVIQVAMGWTNSHLYQFEIDDARFTDPDIMDDPNPDDRDSRIIRLADLGLTKGASFLYEYDFGDGWNHMITLERIQEVEEGMVYPYCVAGARACPPEDCGGPSGYQNLLSILADPQHPEHEEFRRWAPEGFDPELCDVQGVNSVLGRSRRRGRRRK